LKSAFVAAAALIAVASTMLAGSGLRPDPTRPSANAALDEGYRDMYNLRFADAHRTFQRWKAEHPGDALAPASDAAAYLFSEFDRLQILQSEFFTDDREFKSRPKLTPDPNVKTAFLKQLDDSERIANAALQHDAKDANAQFAKVLSLGLRSDYMALIEKRYVPSIRYMKTARTLAQDLLAQSPSYYDAYLAVGVENYMLGIKAAPVRWILSFAGAQTDKDQGIRELKLTAEKGHYLQPFARLLLAVAALRDQDKNTAKQLLAGLVEEFPKNQLYAKELARLH
jgi:hypothetical protein